MSIDLLKKEYEEYLNTLNIHTLRNVAREVGVYKPTDGKKGELIERTISVLIGTVPPSPPSKRGAPLKEDALDPKYLLELERIRKEYAVRTGFSGTFENVLSVRGKGEQIDEYSQPLYTGVLEILPNGSGYLRVKNCQVTPEKDVFVSAQNVLLWSLKAGDYVVGFAEKKDKNASSVLTQVLSVNTESQYQPRKAFEEFSAYYPEEKIKFSHKDNQLFLRYIDLFAPIGKGQRALVGVPPRTEANRLLKDFARSVKKKIDEGENFHVLSLLINERPEEVTEFCRTFPGEIIYTTFNQSPQEQLRIIKLAFERAKRLAETGKDVVLFLNSLTRFTLLSNANVTEENTVAHGLHFNAFSLPKNCLSQAVNLKDCGSITVFAVVSVDTNNPTDEMIVREFKEICNAYIELDEELMKKHGGPILSVLKSYTLKEEKILSVDEAECSTYVRNHCISDGGEKLYSSIQSTPDNQAFIRKILNR